MKNLSSSLISLVLVNGSYLFSLGQLLEDGQFGRVGLIVPVHVVPESVHARGNVTVHHPNTGVRDAGVVLKSLGHVPSNRAQVRWG